MNPFLMKRRVEFICMALGVPTVYIPLGVLALIVLLGMCCGCTSEETIDKINRLPSDDAINKRYEHVSKSAPESLKPFYDPQLTQDLNR